MTMKEMLETFGIKNPTSKSINHPKMRQLLNYCNKNDIDIFEHDFLINEDAFLTLVQNIHSFETLMLIVKKASVLLNIDYNPKEMAIFYNYYDPQILQYNLDNEILIDEEYLKYASKEWTEHNFINQRKILVWENDRLILKENPYHDEEYIASFDLNVQALKKAKEHNLLKEAIVTLQGD